MNQQKPVELQFTATNVPQAIADELADFFNSPWKPTTAEGEAAFDLTCQITEIDSDSREQEKNPFPVHAMQKQEMERLSQARADLVQRLDDLCSLTSEAEKDATPWHLLATPTELIDAFGKYTGMDKAWFNNAKDTPGLKAALHTAGQGGRGGREPLYYVMPVMQWLADTKRRKGRPMEQATGWRVLEHKFPKVHEEYLGQKPDME